MPSIEILEVAPRAGQLRVRFRIAEANESPGRYDVALLLTEVDGTRNGRDEWMLSYGAPVNGRCLARSGTLASSAQDDPLSFQITHRDTRPGEYTYDFAGAAVLNALTNDDGAPARLAAYAYMLRRDDPFAMYVSPRNAESTYRYVRSDFF